MTAGKPGSGRLTSADIGLAGLCIGCGSCIAQHDDPSARMEWDAYGQLKPRSARQLQGHVPRFDRICPFSPNSRNEDELAASLFPTANHADNAIGRYRSAYVGHVEEGNFRETGSSGGAVSWVATELLRTGQVDAVAHVMPCDPRTAGRLFRYEISRTVSDIQAGACSRYYPVEMSGVLKTIRATPGRYAVVGIPCFIKAVNLLRAEDEIVRDRIAFTLGLFCGHMKSAFFADSIALQMGLDLNKVETVDYRVKTPGRPANWYRARVALDDGSAREKDWWHLADGDWGAGFFQNSACNFCDDVVAETADIAFGDAWIEPYCSDARGTNVIIVRHPQLEELVETGVRGGRLAFRPVDAGFIRETQSAGLRQRREGLAYRLTRRPPPIAIEKRTASHSATIRWRRKLVYSARYAISAWSPRVFRAVRQIKLLQLYVWWAKSVLGLYRALAYSRGPLGNLLDAIPGQDRSSRE